MEDGSAAIRERVECARFRSDKKINCNARMGPRQIRQHCKLSDELQELIRVAMTELNLSGRAYDRSLKVSRTVADLQSGDEITTEHISEAIQYRPSIALFGVETQLGPMKALSKQARSAARKRTRAERSAAAKKAERTRARNK